MDHGGISSGMLKRQKQEIPRSRSIWAPVPLSQQANKGITTINKPDGSRQLRHGRGEKDYVWSVEDPSRPLLELLYP